MIKYNLVCKECNLAFDSWFASSKEYEKLKKNKLLNCHFCNSLDIKKNLMAPKMIKKNSTNSNVHEEQKHKNIRNTLKEYQKFIKNNFKYVGKDFAYEARSIYYQNKKKEKGIYGVASKKDIKELKEEGIETHMMPWVEDKNN